MEKNFKVKIEEFKIKWPELIDDKTIYFFKRGMEIQQMLLEKRQPAIGAEHYFESVILEEKYPANSKEYVKCQKAFNLGFFADIRLPKFQI